MYIFVQAVLGVFLSLLIATSAHAKADLIDINVTKKTEFTDVAQARKEVLKQIIQEQSEKHIQSLIGEERLNKNRALIQAKIIKKHGLYIPFVKVEKIKAEEEDGVELTVHLKFSPKSLRTLLLQHGLFYKSKGIQTILPLFTITDAVNGSQRVWWLGQYGNSVLTHAAQSFDTELKNAGFEKGFYFINPSFVHLDTIVPPRLRIPSLSVEDNLDFARAFGATLFIKGKIQLTPALNKTKEYEIRVQLVAAHVNDGRSIGEVVRNYTTESGPFTQVVQDKLQTVIPKVSKNLISQIYSSWQRGTLGAQNLQLIVRGEFSYPGLRKFKSSVINNIPGVKRLKERRFRTGEAIYSMDSSLSTRQLGNILESNKLSGFRVRVKDIKDTSLEVYITTTK